MKTHIAFVLFACALGACTDDLGGEPAITSIDFHYGDDSPTLDTGAAVLDKDDATKMYIQLGAGGVDCDLDLQAFDGKSPPHSTFLVMQVPRMPGTYANVSVAAMKIESLHYHYSGSQGDVTVDTVGDRVTGSLANFDTESDTGGTISASGTFDVKACF